MSNGEVLLKIDKIVGSCETKAHFLVAADYIVAAHKGQHISHADGNYWLGIINGIAFEKERNGVLK